MISLCYLIIYKPFEESLMQNLEVFNNITEMILLYSVLSITNANPFALHPFYDALFLTPLVGNICVHFYFLLKSSFIDVKQRISKHKFFKKIKRALKRKAPKGEIEERMGEP